jgi:hypothetical protein
MSRGGSIFGLKARYHWTMSVPKFLFPLLCLVFAGVGAGSAQSLPEPRAVRCFALVVEDSSSEANELYLKNMGLKPEAMRAFVPSHFALESGRVTIEEGESDFGYEAETPRLVARKGNLALYEVEASIRGPLPPQPAKTVVVDIPFAVLFSSGDVEQPGLRAIEAAAKKLGWKEGSAWIRSMRLKGSQTLRVEVGFAP